MPSVPVSVEKVLSVVFGDAQWKLVHRDDRRTILEFNWSERGISIQLIVVGSRRAVLGNHYHARREEQFLLVAGHADVFLGYFDEASGSSESRKYLLDPAEALHVGANTSHAFVLDPGSILACVSSENFREDDPDMPKVDFVRLADDGTVEVLHYQLAGV